MNHCCWLSRLVLSFLLGTLAVSGRKRGWPQPRRWLLSTKNFGKGLVLLPKGAAWKASLGGRLPKLVDPLRHSVPLNEARRNFHVILFLWWLARRARPQEAVRRRIRLHRRCLFFTCHARNEGASAHTPLLHAVGQTELSAAALLRKRQRRHMARVNA